MTVSLAVLDSTPSIARFGYTATMSNGVVVKDTTSLRERHPVADVADHVHRPGKRAGWRKHHDRARAHSMLAATSGQATRSSSRSSPSRVTTLRRGLPVHPAAFRNQGATLKIDGHDPSQIRAIGYEMRTLPDSTLIGSGKHPASGRYAVAPTTRRASSSTTIASTGARGVPGRLGGRQPWQPWHILPRGFSRRRRIRDSRSP